MPEVQLVSRLEIESKNMGWYTVLNNREWATLIWIIVFIAWAASLTQVRASFRGVLKAFFVKPIIISLILMACYIVGMVLGLSRIGLWDSSQLKNTIIWSVTVGFVMLMDINSVKKDENYFRKAILDNLKVSIFLEYLINVYVFSLAVELVLVPAAVFLGAMLAVAKLDEKHKQAAGCLNGIQVILGLGLIGFALYNAYVDLRNLTTFNTAIDFFSPILLSLLFLPFVYMALIYSTYEVFYVRLQFFIQDPALRKYTKLQAALFCKLNLKMLDRFSKKLIRQRPNNRQEVLELLRNSKSSST